MLNVRVPLFVCQSMSVCLCLSVCVSLSVCWTRPDVVDGRQRLRCSGTELRSVLLHEERSNGGGTEATPGVWEWFCWRTTEVHGDVQQELPEGLVGTARRPEVPDRGLVKGTQSPMTFSPRWGYGPRRRDSTKSDNIMFEV